MLQIFLILLLGLTNLPKTTPCLASYAQCGSMSYNGETDCCAPSTCVYSNPWYSQCIPSTTPSNTGCSALWGQCGGKTWGGPTCCDYSTCIYSNDDYSQCLSTTQSPMSSSSSTSSASTSSATQSSSASTSSATQSSSASASSAARSGSASTSSATQSSSTASSNQGCSILYAQCGGMNWNGLTTCCSGSTCQYSNPYYSQCLPPVGSSTASSTASSSSGSGGSTASSTTLPSGNDNRQSGTTTRYWDCCKASCGWPGKASVSSPVQTCAAGGTPVDANTPSGCDGGGTGYMCSNQQPWNVSSTLSYGYAAAKIAGQGESDWCCVCYSLIFTSTSITGKELILQVTNTGGDLRDNQFDLAMPGGGVGIFNGCQSQFSGSFAGGAQYGGVSQRSDCDGFPIDLRKGCYWRFDWFQNADNPSMSFKKVDCPTLLTDNTKCIRNQP